MPVSSAGVGEFGFKKVRMRPFWLQENSFVIYDLRFDCRYLVRVQSVTNQGVLGATTHLTVSTPSCHDVTVVGTVMPDCPHTGLSRLCDIYLLFIYLFAKNTHSNHN